MIEVVNPSHVFGEITKVVEVKSNQQIMDHKNRMFWPKYASVTWKRDSIGGKWYVIAWEIYSDKGSLRGTAKASAPEGSEGIFKVSMPRIAF